jgi:hypothetical protein
MKKVKILTWNELVKKSNLTSIYSIVPPENFSKCFLPKMEIEMPADRVIEINDAMLWMNSYNRWHIEDWMIDHSYNPNWKPKLGETYWYIDAWFGIEKTTRIKSPFDDSQMRVKNYFRTRDEARDALKKIKQILKVCK